MKFLQINKIVLLIIFCILLIVYTVSDVESTYNYVFIIPLVFVINCLLETKFYIKYSLMLYILYVLSLIKYFITPLIIIFTNNIKTIGTVPTDSNFKLAVFINVLEIITLFIVKYIFIKIKKSKKNSFVFEWKNLSKNINLKFLIIFFAFLFFIIVFKHLMLPKDIFSDPFVTDDSEPKTSLGIVAKWIKLISLPIAVIFFIKNFKKIAYPLSILMFLLFGYLQLSTSRWTILFYTIISFCFLLKVFGKRVIKIIFPVTGILIFLILSISIYKFSWSVKDSDNKFRDVIFVMSDQFQSYFSGPTLVAQCIELDANPTYNYKIGVQTFINDFMGSIPVLSSNFDQQNRINYIFNEYIFGLNTSLSTQIIPMSGLGYIYFGVFGSTILVAIYTYIGLILERRANQTKDLINYWILIYMSIWCISSIIFSSQLIWGNLIANYIILYCFNSFINKINLKNGY